MKMENIKSRRAIKITVTIITGELRLRRLTEGMEGRSAGNLLSGQTSHAEREKGNNKPEQHAECLFLILERYLRWIPMMMMMKIKTRT